MRRGWIAIGLVGCALAGLAPGALRGQAAPGCAEAEARQFDFWLGDWTIEQRILRPDGSYVELPAQTSVRSAAGGCALVEEWRGTVQFFWAGMEEPAELHGLSVRAWDPDNRTWKISWLDDLDPVLGEPFAGGFQDGRGIFTQTSTGADGVERTSRITFDNPADGVVDWSLESTRDGGATWTLLWSMHMTRESGGAEGSIGAKGSVGAAGSDRAAILALHERTRRAHFERDAGAFLAGTAESWLRVSDGEVAERRKAEQLPRLQEYLERMEFDAVEDARPTVVEVSDDGTLAWLLGAVDVRGRYHGEGGGLEPVAFRAAFLHVYRKGPEGWERVAEADSQRPLE